MKVIKTSEDGWDCVPQLNNVAKTLSFLDPYLYEIRTCVRSSSVEDMVNGIKDTLEEALEELNEIDTDIEFEYDPNIDDDYAKGGETFGDINIGMF